MADAELDLRAQRTPNPNSMLFHVNRDLTDKKTGETYSTDEAAADSPLAAGILRVTGVSSVFFLPRSITVTRDPTVAWEDILPEVENAIRENLGA